MKIETLKKGDRICVIDEDLCGEFAFAKAEKITFICEHGFEHTRPASQLISASNFDFDTPVQPDLPEVSTNTQKRKDPVELIVDLHLHEVVSYATNMTNHEKVTAQINKAKTALEEARLKRISKVILIHGVGKGKLKKELHHLLAGKANINYHDADYRRFGQGATEVVFYKFN